MSEPIASLLSESRVFPPPAAFASGAHVRDRSLHERAARDRLAFWEEQARELAWFRPWETVLQWEVPDARWFVGGQLNACFNCVDRHVEEGRGDRIAWIAEGEPGDVRTFTYADVWREVGRLANALKELGVRRGDRVCLYMPMVPELPLAMLACARIGAVHSVVFGGFSAPSLHERIVDAGAKLLITADGGWRRGSIVPLKKTADEALALGCPTVERVLVLERAGTPGAAPHGLTVPDYDQGTWEPDRDVWWHEIVPRQRVECPCEPMESEDLLFILYTSGSTGKPKGIVHTTGGYLTQVRATARWVFDLKDSDVYWCTADCGWITGHSYVVYGPMANGATVVLYEGAPDTPDKDRFWRLIERHRVTILYTAPTAIRTFMKWGEEYPARCDLSSLRLLGTVGEPINPEAWMWYHRVIGGERCPIVDTWWQTETGAIMIAPLPGLTPTKPGSATFPLPGISAEIVDFSGEPLGPESTSGGYLVLTEPWPSMLRGIYGDHDRYVQTYWSRFPGRYFTGDGARRDEEGYYWLLGRVDDVMLVAGHNISTMEVESALVSHPAVAEAAVIGRSHEIKGQAIAAFVILAVGFESSPELAEDIRQHVGRVIGRIAIPDDLVICADLPKTRSGKIMRRLLRDVAEGRALGDTSTLADPAVVQALREKYEGSEG